MQRRSIPEQSGCYAFTSDPGPLLPEQKVLYIGKANNLRQRLGGYLVDYMKTVPTKHKGGQFVFAHRHQHSDYKVWLRWTVYGGILEEVEASLIGFYNPQYNSRWEEPLLDDEELLDPQFLG